MAEASPTALSDYDIFSAQFRNCPYPTWAAMQRACPVTHSDRLGGSWMVARYDDVRDLVRDNVRLSSRSTEVGGPRESSGGLLIPPITSDPPRHQLDRDRLMPFFHPKQIATLESDIRTLARSLVQPLATAGHGDAATDFAQRLTITVLTRHLLDVPEEMQPQFIDWTLRLLREGPLDQAVRTAAVREMIDYFSPLLDQRAGGTGDDLISYLGRAEVEGVPLDRKTKIGSVMVVMIAGADTTWSALSAALFHLGTHPGDLQLLVDEPELMSTAIEELLRVYAPVMLARVTTDSIEVHDQQIGAGERVLLPLGAANRDPTMFDDPDAVQLDRKRNRHLTFGSGPHRCLGSPLARLELRVALEEWLAAIPRFEVVDPAAVQWTGGSVRGPERVPFRVRTGAGAGAGAEGDRP
jgi:cytochrome P450